MPNLSEILIYTGEIPLTLIIWSLFIGVTVAIIASFIIKVKFGAFMHALLKMDAISPEKAVTLEETGLKRSFFVKFGLRAKANYRNLIVAITDDGKFYANEHTTIMPPVFKDYVIIRRKKHTISEEKAEDENKDEPEIEESAISRRLRLEKEKSESTNNSATENIIESPIDNSDELEKYLKLTEQLPKERVKFNIKTAKYYIPQQLHDRAASLYTSKPTLLIQVLLGILALAVVAILAEPVINLLTDFLGNLTA